jgi:processive 1,2-diacylglycerol beta-glucosyltransferase
MLLALSINPEEDMKYLILYGSCGHGHQRAAEYVAEELRSRGHDDVAVIDFLNYTTSFFKKSYPFVYKYSVTHIAWLWKIGFDITNLKCLNWLIRPLRRFSNHVHANRLEQFLIKENPEYIILTHFLPSEICSNLSRKKLITSKIITIITDTVAHATWVNRNSDFFIGLAEETKHELVKWNIHPEKIKILGIPISQKFTIQNKRDEYREKHGLKNDLFTVLLTSGSFGMGPLEKAVDILDEYADRIQAAVVCGNNGALLKKLGTKDLRIHLKVFPFIDFMDELMEASDIVITKSGGLTMCESLAKELPMIICRPIPGQETYNADFLTKNNAAFRISHVHEIKDIIDSVLHNDAIIAEKKNNIRRIHKPFSTRNIVDFIESLKGV